MTSDANPAPVTPGPAGLMFETRFVPTGKVSAFKIFPYVLESLGAVGHGSAVAVGEGGLQLTLPVQVMHNLIATIEKYVAQADQFPAFAAPKFYSPAVEVKSVAVGERLTGLIADLGLCPPDMRVRWVPTGTAGGLLFFAGPPDDGREKAYKEKVLPGVRAIVGALLS